MSAISDVILSIVSKIEAIKAIVVSASNVSKIIAERDEALAGLQDVDAKLGQILSPAVDPEQPADPVIFG